MLAYFNIRTFTSNDIPQVMHLQHAYRQVYPHATVIPGEVYLSPGFDGGKNVFCAEDEGGALLGYAPLYPNLSLEPAIPHTLWAEVRTLPDRGNSDEVKNALFERLLSRAQEIASASPGGSPTRLTFQYHPSETASIAYVESKGCHYSESVFRLLRDLDETLPQIQIPKGFTVRLLDVSSVADMHEYITARNEAFPEATITLAGWQGFLASPAWLDGVTFIANDGPQVAGGLSAYWDEGLGQAVGMPAGYTEYIFVREKWRKQGLAACLIGHGLSYLKGQGKQAALLEVKAANRQALELYFRLGYQQVDETRLFVLLV